MDLSEKILLLLDGKAAPEVTFALGHAIAVVLVDCEIEPEKMFGLISDLQVLYESKKEEVEIH